MLDAMQSRVPVRDSNTDANDSKLACRVVTLCRVVAS